MKPTKDPDVIAAAVTVITTTNAYINTDQTGMTARANAAAYLADLFASYRNGVSD